MRIGVMGEQSSVSCNFPTASVERFMTIAYRGNGLFTVVKEHEDILGQPATRIVHTNAEAIRRVPGPCGIVYRPQEAGDWAGVGVQI